MCIPHGALTAALYWIQQVSEESWTDLSWSLKHDEHGDISVPCGKNQEIDTDLMSSHATMKTTRNTTQDAFRQPCHILSGISPEMTSNKAYQALSHTNSHKAVAAERCNIRAVTFWASASWLIRTCWVRTDHLSLRLTITLTEDWPFLLTLMQERLAAVFTVVLGAKQPEIHKAVTVRVHIYKRSYFHPVHTHYTHCFYLFAIQS